MNKVKTITAYHALVEGEFVMVGVEFESTGGFICHLTEDFLNIPISEIEKKIHESRSVITGTLPNRDRLIPLRIM